LKDLQYPVVGQNHPIRRLSNVHTTIGILDIEIANLKNNILVPSILILYYPITIIGPCLNAEF
jgi:hypothetical protein